MILWYFALFLTFFGRLVGVLGVFSLQHFLQHFSRSDLYLLKKINKKSPHFCRDFIVKKRMGEFTLMIYPLSHSY
jgi:hypothetical protein